MDDVGAIQRGLEQLDRLRASRNGHAGLTAATGIDLSRPAYALLRRIDEDGPATLGDLARATGMDAASTGRQVRRLEELGFVERAPDAADGRVITVSITPPATTLASASPRCSKRTCATRSAGGPPPTATSSASCSPASSTTSATSNSATSGAPHDHAHRHRCHRPDDQLPQAERVEDLRLPAAETTRGDDESRGVPRRLHVQGRAEQARRGRRRRRRSTIGEMDKWGVDIGPGRRRAARPEQAQERSPRSLRRQPRGRPQRHHRHGAQDPRVQGRARHQGGHHVPGRLQPAGAGRTTGATTRSTRRASTSTSRSSQRRDRRAALPVDVPGRRCTSTRSVTTSPSCAS